MKTIQKIAKAKFKISTDNVANSEIELDFNPIIHEFALEGDYQLIHWQAKPKGHRQWGIYSSKTDSYHSIADFDEVKSKPLQLNDETATTVPSAVLLVSGCKLILIDDVAKFCPKQITIAV